MSHPLQSDCLYTKPLSQTIVESMFDGDKTSVTERQQIITLCRSHERLRNREIET